MLRSWLCVLAALRFSWLVRWLRSRSWRRVHLRFPMGTFGLRPKARLRRIDRRCRSIDNLEDVRSFASAARGDEERPDAGVPKDRTSSSNIVRCWAKEPAQRASHARARPALLCNYTKKKLVTASTTSACGVRCADFCILATFDACV